MKVSPRNNLKIDFYTHKILCLLIYLLFGNCYYIKAQDIENIKKEKPFKINGSVGGGTFFYTSNEPYKTRDPFAWNLYASVNPSIYGFSLPFSFSITQYSKSFTQPFTQFGISPKYKWVTLHLGYRSINLSPLIFNGNTFLGGGIEISPKALRFSAFYGRLNKAIDMQTIPGKIIQPQYGRIGHGASLGFSKNNQEMSFQYLFAKDNARSLKNVVDSLTRVKPQQNFVLGTNWKFTILKKISFTGSFAASMLSMDSRYGDFQFSGNTKGLKYLTWIMPYTVSTVFGFSGQTRLTLNLKKFNFSTGYKRVQPDFKSLGVSYTLSDLEMMNVTSGVRLFKGKLNLNGSYAYQHNNLYRKRISSLQTQTGNLILTAIINKNISLNSYANVVNIYQADGSLHINDSIRMNQLMSSFSLAPNFMFQSPKLQQTISTSLSYTNLNDRNSFTKNNTSGIGLNSSVNYSINFSKVFKGINVGVNHSLYEQTSSKYNTIGVVVGGNAQFLKEHNLTLNGNFGYFFNRATNAKVNNNYTFSFTCNYRYNKHNFSLYSSLVYTPPIDLDPLNKVYNVPYFVSSYNLSGGVNYSYSF